jgi:hypothetical protein
MKKQGDKEILICECHSTDHQIVIYYEEEEIGDHKHNMCYAHIHLADRSSCWNRVVYGVKYIFGRKSRFGAWDEFIFHPNDADKLQEIVNYLKDNVED